MAVGGCQAAAQHDLVAEPSLADQAAAVIAGTSDRIRLESTTVSDADLAALKNLSKLRELLLDDSRSRITAAGMKHLAALPQLEHLRIRGPGIDDSALALLSGIRSLRILNLPQADFTDAGLEHLQKLPHLEQLRIGSARVTSAGMKAIARLPALKRLHLIDVPIDDAGLRELARIERLESLYIDGAQVSDEALEDLFRSRPGLHVHLNQQHHDRDPHHHEHAP